jgi:hypothetical protein
MSAMTLTPSERLMLGLVTHEPQFTITREHVGTTEPVLVFTTLSFFNTLRVLFSKLPKSLRDVLDALAEMERDQDL